MSATVTCAKLGHELPAIDPATSEGAQALKMCTLIGGPELAARVQREISLEAWRMWRGHMLMVINEFRLDATSDESNAVLRQYMEEFLFGPGRHIPNYVPPSS